MGCSETTGRNQTDASLKAEWAGADAHVAARLDAGELAADEVVRVARERADEVVADARECTDPPSTRSARARKRADVLVANERARADATLGAERAARKQYLADFLAAERAATNEDLSGERAHADTAIAARDAFLATVSHDLRSLLSGLSLNATIVDRLAPEGAAGDALRQHAARSQRMVARMGRLVGDLLDIVSIEEGNLAIVLDQVEIASLVRDTLDAFAPIAAAKNITLDADADAGPLPTHAQMDGGRILQVLANLVSNAIKFTPSGGRVSIRVHLEDHELHFSVRDTGIGIPEHALKQIFERFRQVSVDRRGLGLGLHISKCIVEAQGGRIWAMSTVGAGSTFHFTLPVVPP